VERRGGELWGPPSAVFRSVQVWSVLAILDLDGYAFVKKIHFFSLFFSFYYFSSYELG
jgi:hypothetical protein